MNENIYPQLTQELVPPQEPAETINIYPQLTQELVPVKEPAETTSPQVPQDPTLVKVPVPAQTPKKAEGQWDPDVTVTERSQVVIIMSSAASAICLTLSIGFFILSRHYFTLAADADDLRSSLTETNCTLVKALSPFESICEHHACIVIPLNFTVEYRGARRYQVAEETRPIAEATRILTHLSTLFPAGSTRQCFVGKDDLLLYIPKANEWRTPAIAEACLSVASGFASVYLAIGTVIYCVKRGKCHRRNTGAYTRV
ncbi:MAG: hypothetical protein KGL39_10970 [Patescibacteria group bacterium]|nr:hypothetical protein [Patescibacteria group bacterium]